MFNSKLINILTALDKPFFNSYKKFAKKRLGENNVKALKLLDVLTREHPKFSGNTIDRNKLFKKIFPGVKEINIAQLRHIMTDLTKLLDEFLIDNELKANKFRKKYLLARAYRKIGLNRYHQSEIAEILKGLGDDERRDSRYYFKQYQVYEDLFRNNTLMKSVDKLSTVETVLTNLDKLYFIEKLKYACELVNTKNIRNITYENNFFEDVVKYIEIDQIYKTPVLKVYYLAFKTLTDLKNEHNFTELKHILKQYPEHFNKYELNEIYIYARNYCVRQINNKNDKYIQELFDLFLILLNNEMLFSGTYLSQWDYRNLMQLGNRLKKFDWVENFLESYKERLNPLERENAYFFNKAAFEFEKQNYNKTIELLNQVNYTDTFYQFETKVLLSKAYYEQNEMVPLLALIESFRVLTHRNKTLSLKLLNSYNAYISIISRLMRLKHGTKISIPKLEERLNKYPIINNRSWIIKKIEELK